jgi:hypothetical protein
MKKALVSLVIGDRYLRFWQQYCERSWRAYAQRHGYDIVIFDSPIADSPYGDLTGYASSLPLLSQHRETVEICAIPDVLCDRACGSGRRRSSRWSASSRSARSSPHLVLAGQPKAKIRPYRENRLIGERTDDVRLVAQK